MHRQQNAPRVQNMLNQKHVVSTTVGGNGRASNKRPKVKPLLHARVIGNTLMTLIIILINAKVEQLYGDN
jgi:hypothetical protein